MRKGKNIIFSALLLLYQGGLMAQEEMQAIVVDHLGNAVKGVKVSLLGEKSNSVITDENGFFSIYAEEGQYLELNWGDRQIKRIRLEKGIDKIVLSKEQNMIDLGYIKTNSEALTQSVSSIYSETLDKKSTSIVSNALYGEISGLQAKQNVGFNAGAGWQVRGAGSPLVIVDGFQRGITWMSMDEIESITVLKDGAATALYGSRGANGVVLVTTKRGTYDSFDINVDYNHGFDIPVNRPEMADSYTYAMAVNEALRYDGLPEIYDKKALQAFRDGSMPDIYPNTNWVNEGMRDLGASNNLNIDFSGGGKKLRYFGAIEYKNRFGLLNPEYTDYTGRYNSQVRNYGLNTRMNIDVDMTSTTAIKVGLFAAIAETREPRSGQSLAGLYSIPSAAFPVKTTNGYWGSNMIYKTNPIANIADYGYQQTNSRMFEADLRITQDLSMLLKGLNAEIAVAYDNSADFIEVGSKGYQYEVNTINEYGDIFSQIEGDNSSYTITKSTLDGQMIRSNLETKLGYDNAFGKHQLRLSAMYHQDMQEGIGVNSAVYRQSIIGLAGYNFSNRYMIDLVANYSGNSYMPEGDRFRFYPAVSVAWNLSSENFMKNISFIDCLKFRTSYGRSGLETGLSYGMNKAFWVSGPGYVFGDGLNTSGGLYENEVMAGSYDMETSDKFNIGLDLKMFKHLLFTVDAYVDKRTDIFVNNNLVSGMFGLSLPKQNVGETKYRGLEFNIGWNDDTNPFKYYVNANLSVLDSEIIEAGEALQPYDYLYKKGNKVDQFFGLEAIGFFNDQADIDNSPKQTFSDVRPGDIKYKDQNDDKKIDSYDVVPLGKSTSIPEMVYGLNLGFEYKGFGVDMTFQGISGISKHLSVDHIHRPLMNNKNISTWYLKDKVRWTETTKDIANVPRLSTINNSNNMQLSSLWLEDGSFFKMRNLNIYYSLPDRWVKKIKMDKCKVYVRGENLFSLDKIDYFNCESLTLNYPDITSVQLGVNINF